MPASSSDTSHSYESDHGYFVESGDDDEGDVEIEAEDQEKYQKGLYFPVCIGDYIANRYRIVHKLGHGAFSTVWLAHDTNMKKDVALKIMIPGDAAEHELRVQKEIMQTVKDISRLILYTDVFFICDDNDRDHCVLSFPVRGPGLSATGCGIPRPTRVLAAKQLLEALEALHSAGFVHGDLNDNNVMWGMIPLDDYDTATKYKHLGRPQKVALQLQKSAELVRPAKISASLLTDKIYLGDFGLATRSDIQGMKEWQPPMQYCAPEIRHNFKSSFASDMWSYMCIFAQLYFGGSIFSGLSSIVNTVGPMPKEWKGLLQASEESWYDQSRKIDFQGKIEYRLGCLAVDADAIERSHVVSIMIKGFRYLPQERMTATQLLRDPSFQALMKIYS